MTTSPLVSPGQNARPTPLIRPIGIPVFPILGQLLGFKAIGKHAPYLARARARGFKRQVAAIRRPRGMLIPASIVGQLDDPSTGNFHDVNVVGSCLCDAPVKGHKQPVG